MIDHFSPALAGSTISPPADKSLHRANIEARRIANGSPAIVPIAARAISTTAARFLEKVNARIASITADKALHKRDGDFDLVERDEALIGELEALAVDLREFVL